MVLGELTDVLVDIKDTRSATANQDRLEQVVERIREMDSRMSDLGEPDSEQKAELEEKYKPELERAMRRFSQESLRIAQDPALAAKVGPALQQLQTLGN